jgi:hypothetical protein
MIFKNKDGSERPHLRLNDSWWEIYDAACKARLISWSDCCRGRSGLDLGLRHSRSLQRSKTQPKARIKMMQNEKKLGHAVNEQKLHDDMISSLTLPSHHERLNLRVSILSLENHILWLLPSRIPLLSTCFCQSISGRSSIQRKCSHDFSHLSSYLQFCVAHVQLLSLLHNASSPDT